MTDSLKDRIARLEKEVAELRKSAEEKRAESLKITGDICLSQHALTEMWYHVVCNNTLEGLPRPVWSVLMEGTFQKLLKRLETITTSEKYTPLRKRFGLE